MRARRQRHARPVAIAVFATAIAMAQWLPRSCYAAPPSAASLTSEASARRQTVRSIVKPPADDDDSAASLQEYIEDLRKAYGGDYRHIPLEVKARFFEWELFRYHRLVHGAVACRALLPDGPGEPALPQPGWDCSTWNGALLAALSYQYAVTKRPETLKQIGDLLQGLHVFLEATGQPGLIARAVFPGDARPEPDMQPRELSDGRSYFVRSSAAKGTVNQVVGGYIMMMLFAAGDLPPQLREMARSDLTLMVAHLVNYDYHLTEADGERTPYGNLTPMIGSHGVPFNAQVAYQIVAAGHYFPARDPHVRERIDKRFHYLRSDHHVYYENPRRHLIRPQRVGTNPLVKGMNDRNHVTNAAFAALFLEVEQARRHGRDLDRRFLYELGRTMYWSMRSLRGQRNSLCNFMWAALLSDREVFDAVVPREQQQVRAEVERGVVEGIEQLRRFRLDRFGRHGNEVSTDTVEWVDAHRPDPYHWKVNPKLSWESTGPPSGRYVAAVDFLHAYWLMRGFSLDTLPAARRTHAAVLRR